MDNNRINLEKIERLLDKFEIEIKKKRNDKNFSSASSFMDNINKVEYSSIICN